MSAVVETSPHYAADYETIHALLPGKHLPWLEALREHAALRFSRQGFPSVRDEEWKYTNLSSFTKKRFRIVADENNPADVQDMLKTCQLPGCWTVTLVNGHFCAALSQLEDLPEGVVIGSLADALEQVPERVESYFGKALTDSEHGFIHFNTAYFTDGLFCYIPEKTVLDKPVQVVHLVTETEALSATRHIIALDAQAQAQIIETYAGREKNAYLSAAVSEVFIGRNAFLASYKLQNEAAGAFHFSGSYVKQEREARFKQDNFAFGGTLARHEIHTDLRQAAECELNGLYVGVKKQHLDNHTRINHLEPYGCSREFYKGVLDQRARGVLQGRVTVFDGALKTDSQMHNRNLLLSEFAEADSKPQLEIYADDVKCAHGVTIGQLNEQSVFYLQSRCMDSETARNMLTFAFANEMVEKIDLEPFKALVCAQLLLHFPQTGIVREWL